MAKIIKEMTKQFVHGYIKGGTKESWLGDGFITGANVVLEIFEEIVENRNFCTFPKLIHQELLDKIKELKGE